MIYVQNSSFHFDRLAHQAKHCLLMKEKSNFQIYKNTQTTKNDNSCVIFNAFVHLVIIMVNESTGSRRWMISYEMVAILSLLTVWFAYPASCSFDVILPTREVQVILGG